MNSQSLFQTYPYAPIDFVRGENCTLFTSKEEKYLDFYSGISCTNLGHSNERVVGALRDQAEKIWYHSNYFCHENTKLLAEKISDSLPFEAQVFFGNSGAEVNEGALKLARKWAKKNKSQNATEIICFENSFHGRTFGTLSCTGKTKMREEFSPLLSGVHFAKLNDIESVKSKISPSTSCILLETIQGEGGIHLAERQFLADLRDLCDAENILLIFDEIQVGMGRTGALWSFEKSGVSPDIFTTAKALGNGFPIGAFVAKKEIAQAFELGDHGTTFGGNPLACTVALEVFSLYTPAFLEEVQKKGKFMEKALNALHEKFPKTIHAVRGTGMVWGVEMNCEHVSAVYTKMMEEKIITLTAGNGNVWRLLPPLVISQEEMEKFFTVAQKIFAEISE